MKILKAKEHNIDSIERIYDNIHNEEERGLSATGWIRNVYPTKQTAKDALERNDLFIMKDEGKIVAAAIINQIQLDEYKHAAWKHNARDDKIMVLHCLAVDPLEKNKGYGKAFAEFYEEYAIKQGCLSLRMDTNVLNVRARRLYRKLGYDEVGIVKSVFNGIPNVWLVCLEKYLG